ncbi:unnamed protein product [Rotaria sp. Silwood1]|nr:unnamed protein product [Rotaria sp. Silwood1]CAF0905768.1 unnamed protein product [Rotaria sp. Silwood1]CAF3372060.1 unnamed protein product [Rotaria sp. Silwood1]CAF3374383.1 unnamed protein product [Rotaria sp. Silwood1]CAF3375669.1 unnamed protein product [Rotaria sp. Silwood1]
MQSNDFLRSSTTPFIESPHLFTNNLQSQLSMLYALTQQQISSSSSSLLSPSDSKIKRVKKSMPLPNEPPTQVPLISATDSSCLNSTNDRDIVKVVTTAGPQCVDKEFLNQLLTRKNFIPARKRRDFIPNEMKDDHYWERRRKNNLAAKRSREKRRLNDIVLETKVVELTNENEALKAKLNLMLSRLNMKETEMENLFEEEQRLGHICLKPATSASTILAQHNDDDDEHSLQLATSKDSSSSETHDDDESHTCIQHPILYNQLIGNTNDSAIDLSRTEIKTGNLLTTIPSKSPSPLTPSPSPPNESLLQILANQMLKSKQQYQDTSTSSRLLTIASPVETKPTISTLKRNFNQTQQDDEQQHKWNEAAMTLLSLNKPPARIEPQITFQSVINDILRKPNPPKATIDYHSNHNSQQIQGENFHQHTSFNQWKTLMNYFSMPPTQQQQQQSTNFNTNIAHSQQHEPRGDMMPLKLRMKMLNAKS